MALLNTIYNLVQCGTDDAYGTGTKGCDQFLKKASSLWVTKRGFEFDGTKTLDETYVQQLQAEGNLIILKGIRTFTDNSADDTVETYEDGTEIVTLLGKYKFATTFVNGMAFHAALHSLSSFNVYDMLFVDSEGNMLGTKATSGALKGFTVGMLQGQRLMFATDSTSQKEGIAFQLLERAEVDTNYFYIQQKQLDTYYPNLTDGVNEVVLEYDAVPTNLSTTIVVKAKSKNNSQVFTGLLTTDFLLTRNGATLAQSVVESPDGTYTFTVTANSTNDVITARLYDSANSRIGVELDNCIYKSNLITTTVVA